MHKKVDENDTFSAVAKPFRLLGVDLRLLNGTSSEIKVDALIKRALSK